MTPTPLNRLAVLADARDNVAIAKQDLAKGQTLFRSGATVTLLEDCPKGQRFTLVPLAAGAVLVQYGHAFAASLGLEPGQRVTPESIRDLAKGLNELKAKYLARTSWPQLPPALDSGLRFQGIHRADGQVGTRNYYLLVPASFCAADIANKLAAKFDHETELQQFPGLDGVVSAAHTEGCGCNDGKIVERLLLTLKNTIRHPNVCGALVVDLGCEKTSRAVSEPYLGDLGKPVDYLTIQEVGGTGAALRRGEEILRQRLPQLCQVTRVATPLSKLILGTECGASDSFSGITANPLIGAVADQVSAAGGAAILTEFPEIMGGEEILLERMTNRPTVERFFALLEEYLGWAAALKVQMSGNLVAGNKAGGLLNTAIKSLGAILKGGKGPITNALDYGEACTTPGLSLMTGPGNDFESLTGLTAAGANLILFSTGRGTTEGSLLVPVVKISSNSALFQRLPEDMDFDAGRLLEQTGDFQTLSNELLQLSLEVASGKQTWSERWKKRSFQIWTAGKLSL